MKAIAPDTMWHYILLLGIRYNIIIIVNIFWYFSLSGFENQGPEWAFV